MASNPIANAAETLKRLGWNDRMGQQISFILEIDKLKEIWRQTRILDFSRPENDAEHSWHLATMAVILSEYAPAEVDLLRVLKMVLIHDVVEIDAGDTPAFSGVSEKDQYAREVIAADRLFGLLPEELSGEMRGLWDEFEAMESPDALFARAMDRMQPLLHNYFTQGRSWHERGIVAQQVRDRMAVIEGGSAELHRLVSALIEDAVAQGYLAP